MAKVGRPSAITPELLASARRYILEYEDHGDPIPTVAALACVINIRRETLYRWLKEDPNSEISNILKELMQRQERALVKGGLGGAFNAAITKMILTKHGYSDRVEQDHTSSDGSMSPPSRIEIVAAKLADDDGDD